MARPAKLNCDYFSHFVKHDRDLHYLIERFGIEGYYFFYRLREFLCDSDNWTYQIETEADMSYFCKQFSLDKRLVLELIDVCADNGIVDHELWYRAQILWQDELASYLKDAWSGRKAPPPEKPIVDIEKKLSPRVGVSKVVNLVSNSNNLVPSPNNTQRKVKDNKVEDSKTDDNKLNDSIEEKTTPTFPSSSDPNVEGKEEGNEEYIRQVMDEAVKSMLSNKN